MRWTQLDLAARLGPKVRERDIQRWESGEVAPRALILIKMMQLCPDLESLAAFGIDVGKYVAIASSAIAPGIEVGVKQSSARDDDPAFKIGKGRVRAVKKTARKAVCGLCPKKREVARWNFSFA